jgi:hypothetical protein
MKRPRLIKTDTQGHDYGTNIGQSQPRKGLNINNPGWQPGGRNTHPDWKSPEGAQCTDNQCLTEI